MKNLPIPLCAPVVPAILPGDKIRTRRIKPASKPISTPETMRAEYHKTALHRMGIPFEQAIKSPSVRLVLGLNNGEIHPRLA